MNLLREEDNYETPFEGWEYIYQFIPKNAIIWDPFYSRGKAADIAIELGVNLIHQNRDFFTYEPENYTYTISNPPFSQKRRICAKLLELGKPFALLLPTASISAVWFASLFKEKELNFIIPARRLSFHLEGEVRSRASFDTLWVCVDMAHLFRGRNQTIFG